MAQSWSVTVWNHSVHFRICCHWFNLSVWSKSVKCIHYVVPSKIQSRNNTVPQCSVLHLLITLYNFAPVSDDAKMINNGPRSIHVMPKKATVFLKKKYLEFWITSRPCCSFFKCVLFETLKLASSTSQINLVQIPAEATMLSVAASRKRQHLSAILNHPPLACTQMWFMHCLAKSENGTLSVFFNQASHLSLWMQATRGGHRNYPSTVRRCNQPSRPRSMQNLDGLIGCSFVFLVRAQRWFFWLDGGC